MNTSSLVRKSIKATALPFGIPGRTRLGDVAILLYHRVGTGDREIDVPAPAFEEQIAYLAESEIATTLDDALMPGSQGGVVVSVDDGFRDFHDVVLPILARYRVPAILYLATSLVDGRQVPDNDAITWPQLEEAVSTGLVTVGSHTHNHADLSRVSEEVADAEMRRAKDLIEDVLGVPCRHFAYPWSVAGPAAERAARRLFDSAALRWGTNRRGRIDPHRLARVPVLRSDGRAFFRAKARGMLDREAVAYRILRRGPWRHA